MTESEEYRGQRTAQFICVSIGFVSRKQACFEEGGGEDNPKRGVNATWKRCKLENSAVDGTLSFVWPLLASTTEESVEFYRGRGGGAHNVFIVWQS